MYVRTYLRIVSLKTDTKSLELNVNEVKMVANIWAHTDTENNDSEEDDNNDDNSDELYKEWSDIPSRYLQFLYQHNNINNSFLYTDCQCCITCSSVYY